MTAMLDLVDSLTWIISLFASPMTRYRVNGLNGLISLSIADYCDSCSLVACIYVDAHGHQVKASRMRDAVAQL